MLEINRIYQTEIISCADSGDGVCRMDGLAVFVKGACEGDICEICIDKIKKNYALAHLVRIIKPSAFRTSPPCRAYKKCGGCQLMHIKYEKQLAMKKQFVFDALSRIGHIDLSEVSFYDTMGMESPERYRNKMVFPIGKGENGSICGGFYAPKSHQIISLNDCFLGNSLASYYLTHVIDYMKENHISAYNESAHSGLVRRLFVRIGYHSKEVMIVLSVNGKKLPNEQVFIDTLLNATPKEYYLKSIILNENTERNNLVLGENNRTLYGDSFIKDTLCGISFEISPNSFYQVNPIQTERLYQTAIQFAELNGTETVLDLYCGIGTISLCAASHAANVIGVEIVPQAILNAKQNAKRNHIKNAQFYTGDSQSISEKLLQKGLSPDVIFVDPPRKGCDEKTLKNVLDMNPEKIVYVSCNPATLARDLQVLTENGYTLLKIQPVDMFPQTVHVETIALLQRQAM